MNEFDLLFNIRYGQGPYTRTGSFSVLTWRQDFGDALEFANHLTADDLKRRMIAAGSVHSTDFDSFYLKSVVLRQRNVALSDNDRNWRPSDDVSENCDEL